MTTSTQTNIETKPINTESAQTMSKQADNKTADPKTLVLIDGHALAYRMYFALERTAMKTSEGMPTWAVYGFMAAVFSLLQTTKPDAIAVSFDVGRITFRNDMYSEYKANRESMPDELRDQMDLIRESVEVLGIPIYEKKGFEADDVIGTLAEKAFNENWTVRILTGDQDSFQLVHDLDPEKHGHNGRVEILIPSRSPREGLKVYNSQAVYEKLGVWPYQVIDYKGLRGDTSDNIPGIRGVGEKTAVKFLTQYETVEGLYEHLDELPKNKMLEKLTDGKEIAFLSKELATIKKDVELDVNFDDCDLVIPDLEAVTHFFERCEFKQFIRQAPLVLAPFLSEEERVALRAEAAEATNPTKKETTTDKGSSSSTSMQTDTALISGVLRIPHRVITDEKELNTIISQMKQSGVVSIDIETGGLDCLNDPMVGIALSWVNPKNKALQLASLKTANCLHQPDYPTTTPCLAIKKEFSKEELEAVYIPFGHRNPENTDELAGDQLDETLVLSAIKPVLEDETLVKIAHNAKFEINFFKSYGIEFKGLVFDTMVASYVHQPESRHGLKHLGTVHFDYQMEEIKALMGTGKKQIPFSHVPVIPAAAYAVCDAWVTLQLAEKLIKILDTPLQQLLYEVELPLVRVLAAIERKGVALDTPYLKAFSERLDQKIKVEETAVYKLAGKEFNINSPKQVGEVLFDDMGIKPLRKTKGKTGYSTDVKVLEALVDDYEIVAHLLEYRQLFKLKSTYVDALPKLVNPKSNRLHTSFNQTVAATGRLSSSDPNLQNIPIRTELGREIRQAFITEDVKNNVLISADYSQIELRVLAHLSEDKNLVDAFQRGEDIHAATAALVFGVDIKNVSKEMRYKAKAVNFGVIYGQTAHGLSQQLGVPRAEAAEFIDRYFFKYKAVKAFIESIKEEAHKTGKVSTICNRVRDLTEGLNSSNRNIREFSERAAFNTPLQGSAADLMKVAMIRLRQRLLEKERASRMILQVHDELVLEVPKIELDAVTEDVLWAMELNQPLKVPLVVDVHVGDNWME